MPGRRGCRRAGGRRRSCRCPRRGTSGPGTTRPAACPRRRRRGTAGRCGRCRGTSSRRAPGTARRRSSRRARPLVGQPVPDGRHRRRRRRVVGPVGPGAVLVEAVRVGLGEGGREVPVERRPVRRGVTVEPEVGLRVVADRELVVLPRAQPPVAATAVVLHAAALERVVRVRVRTALVVGQVVRAPGDAVAVDVREAGLLAVGAREPAQVVVEGAVLHHQHHDVVDAGGSGVGHRGGRVGAGAERDGACDTCGAGEESAPGEVGRGHRPAPQTSYPKPRAVPA